MRKFRAFSIGEMMIVLLALSIILAASMPIITKRSRATSVDGNNIWLGSSDNSNIYWDSGEYQGVAIGTDKFPNNKYAKLFLNLKEKTDSNKVVNHIIFSYADSVVGKLRLAAKQIEFGNDASSTGENSMAIGHGSKAEQELSIAIGTEAQAGKNTVVFGHNSSSLYENSVAMGIGATGGEDGVAIGSHASNGGNSKGVAIGSGASSGTEGSVAIGSSVTSGEMSVAIGRNISSDSGSVIIGSSIEKDDGSNYGVLIGSDISLKNAMGAVAIGNGISNSYNDVVGSISIGMNSGANFSAVAVGASTHAANEKAIAIGANSNANADNGVVVGYDSTISANADYGVVLGTSSQIGSNSNNSVAIGHETEIESDSPNAIVIGHNAKVKIGGEESMAIGYGAIAKGEHSVSFGPHVTTTPNNQMNIGTYYDASDGIHTINIGNVNGAVNINGNTFIDGNSVAIGIGATSNYVYSVAIGPGATNTATNQLNIGTQYGTGTAGVNTINIGTGSTSININGAAYTTSDKRKKNIIGSYKSGLDDIMKIKTYEFTYKDDKKNKVRVGVIAQELQKIFPNAVKIDDDGFLSIRKEDMFYAVINAIQELYKNYISIKEENRQLKKQLDNLTKRIEKLEQSK